MEKRNFMEIDDNISNLLNSGRAKKGENKGLILKELLTELKQSYGTELSTFNLRNRIKGLNQRQKTNRIVYVLNLGNLKTQKRVYDFKSWNGNKKVEVIEYDYDKNGRVYEKNSRLQDVGNCFKVNRQKKFKFVILE